MTKDILMEDLATDPDAGFKRMEEYLNICNDMLNKRYPLRYELSFRYLNGREFVCNRLEEINRYVISNQTHDPMFVFYPTRVVVDFYMKKIKTMILTTKCLILI